MALGRREPSDQLLHHADHGCQYTSIEFTNRLADWGGDQQLRQRRRLLRQCCHGGVLGDAQEGAPSHPRPLEQFTRSELRTILFDYIEVIYNRSRHQQGLDDRTPAETYAASRAA